MKENNNWLRWVAVLPGSLLAGLLATFPLHWILLATFEHGELISGMNTKPAEYLLYPFIIAVFFIYTGSRIAPKYNFKTAVVLFVIYVLMWMTAISIILFHLISLPNIHLDITRGALSLIGAIIGLYWAKKKNDTENNKIQSTEDVDDLDSIFNDNYSENDSEVDELDDMLSNDEEGESKKENDEMYTYCSCGKEIHWIRKDGIPDTCKYCKTKLK